MRPPSTIAATFSPEQPIKQLWSADDRPHGTWISAYPWIVGLVAWSAVVLVIAYRYDLLWLAPVAFLSWMLSIIGDRAPQRRWRGWSHWYTHDIGGSYIALVTAFVVVALTVDGPINGSASIIPWLAPTIFGTALIEAWRRHITHRSFAE